MSSPPPRRPPLRPPARSRARSATGSHRILSCLRRLTSVHRGGAEAAGRREASACLHSDGTGGPFPSRSAPAPPPVRPPHPSPLPHSAGGGSRTRGSHRFCTRPTQSPRGSCRSLRPCRRTPTGPCKWASLWRGGATRSTGITTASCTAGPWSRTPRRARALQSAAAPPPKAC